MKNIGPIYQKNQRKRKISKKNTSFTKELKKLLKIKNNTNFPTLFPRLRKKKKDKKGIRDEGGTGKIVTVARTRKIRNNSAIIKSNGIRKKYVEAKKNKIFTNKDKN